jgi:hypothetical protein
MAPSDSCLALSKAAGIDDDQIGAVVLARQLLPSARSRVMIAQDPPAPWDIPAKQS